MVVLRTAEHGDLKGVLEVEYESFSEPNPGLLMRLCGVMDTLIVCVRDSFVIGYILSVPTSMDSARVVSLAVRRRYRRNGFGRMLLQESLDQLEGMGVGRVELEVRVSNRAARELYRDLGFVRVGRKPGYYNDGEDAVVMERSV